MTDQEQRPSSTFANHAARFSLSGRRALITGAGRGLGFAIARAMGEAGAAVVLNGRDAVRVEQAARTLRDEGIDAQPLPFDVTDINAAGNALATVNADGNRTIDILVNNATMRDRRATPDLPVEDLDDLLAVNATAAYALTRAVVPDMASKGGGAVINVTSIAGPRARPGDPGYTMAKGALDALTRSHAVEFGGQGIRVNAVAPGFMATEANDAWIDDDVVMGMLKERAAIPRWGRPEEVAGAAVYLASPAASYVTGHVLVVDGGLSVRM
mmetsp:Transcript_28917/g.64191  ORF Transcript_28917/g.64191 Transcript_28917/m.64191 type:complete len:270 (+) Transcript_28917:3-812(+)|eukprot:CAMPEP_0178701518 /NCGR_PEP_ID=MMETSP0699-20121125/12321_1 /TAXON_ID=265572 /ORGANISM="Extubocellulus spinifer, Strain CCMP396" /LENGTH=269 /DNA_ID=CAMNT_0020348067 /DNA_START=34 /DNA_END=843 /DNA_ORIENTATION=-